MARGYNQGQRGHSRKQNRKLNPIGRKAKKVKANGSKRAQAKSRADAHFKVPEMEEQSFQDSMELTLNRGEESSYLPYGRLRFHEATEESTGRLSNHAGNSSAASKESSSQKAAVKKNFTRDLMQKLGLPESQHCLCDIDALQSIASAPERIAPAGSGLANIGNTCFLNSVLQCLCYAPHFSAYFLNKLHSNGGPGSKPCTINGFCILCTLEKFIPRVRKRRGKVTNPNKVSDGP